jgi:ABC-2 type transport system ATP-binding protein
MLHLIRDISHGKGIDVVLSTHILHDVEVVCDHVVVLHQGRRVAQDAVGALVRGPDSAYEVRLKGDRVRFLHCLREEGLDATESDGDGVRVSHGRGTEPILRAAVKAGVQVRRLVRVQATLEDQFTKLLERN